MSTKTFGETFEVKAGEIMSKISELIEAGNVRRIVVKQDERTIAEFPLTVGVVGAVLAPVLAALGAMAALLTHCTIEVERIDGGDDDQSSTKALGTGPQ